MPTPFISENVSRVVGFIVDISWRAVSWNMIYGGTFWDLASSSRLAFKVLKRSMSDSLVRIVIPWVLGVLVAFTLPVYLRRLMVCFALRNLWPLSVIFRPPWPAMSTLRRFWATSWRKMLCHSTLLYSVPMAKVLILSWLKFRMRSLSLPRRTSIR